MNHVPDRSGQPLEKARALSGMGRHADAERALRAHLALHPSDPDALQDLAYALMHLDRRDEAVDAAGAAMARRPDTETSVTLSEALHHAHRDEEAARVAREGLRADPDDPRLALCLARATVKSDPSESLRAALFAVDADPEDADHHVAAGAAYLAFNDDIRLEDGRVIPDGERQRLIERHLREALRLKPDSKTGIDQLGRMYLFEQFAPSRSLAIYLQGGSEHPTDDALPWNATVLPVIMAALALWVPTLVVALLMLIAWPLGALVDDGLLARITCGIGAFGLVWTGAWFVSFLVRGARGRVRMLVRRAIGMAPPFPVLWVLHALGATLLAVAAVRADVGLGRMTVAGVLVLATLTAAATLWPLRNEA